MNVDHNAVISQVKSYDGWTAATISVITAILGHCHNQKHKCFPSIQRLMSVTGLSRRSVQKHLRFLEDNTIIKTMYRHASDGRSTSSIYTVLHLENMNRQAYPDLDGKYYENKTLGARESLSSVHLEGAPNAPLEVLGYKPKEKHVDVLYESSLENSSENYANRSYVDLASPNHKEPKTKRGKSTRLVEMNNSFSDKTCYEEQRLENSRNTFKQNSIRKKVLRFQGDFATLDKSIEIYHVFRNNGWINQSESDFIEYLSYYAAIVERYKNNKIRNPFAYLVQMVKCGLASNMIYARHEEKARNTAKRIHINGQYPKF